MNRIFGSRELAPSSVPTDLSSILVKKDMFGISEEQTNINKLLRLGYVSLYGTKDCRKLLQSL